MSRQLYQLYPPLCRMMKLYTDDADGFAVTSFEFHITLYISHQPTLSVGHTHSIHPIGSLHNEAHLDKSALSSAKRAKILEILRKIGGDPFIVDSELELNIHINLHQKPLLILIVQAITWAQFELLVSHWHHSA